jgi:hypothetical protein
LLADECKDKKREENKKERKCPCGHAIVGGSGWREQCSNGMYMRKSDMDTVLFGAQKSSGSSSHVNSVRVVLVYGLWRRWDFFLFFVPF